MDPDAALARIREIVAGFDRMSRDEEVEAADELVNLIDGLDNWLSKGSYPPAAWCWTSPAAAAGATIRPMLELSTSHLPSHLGTSGLNEIEGVVAYPFDYGWMLWVPPDDPERWMADYRGSDDELSDDQKLVVKLQKRARALQCDFILFDSDGSVEDDLEQWSW